MNDTTMSAFLVLGLVGCPGPEALDPSGASEKDAALDSPAPSDDGAHDAGDSPADADADAPYCMPLDVTRIWCAAPCGTVQQTLHLCTYQTTGASQVICIAEVATGDLYSVAIDAMPSNPAERWRRCTEDERQIWQDLR